MQGSNKKGKLTESQLLEGTAVCLRVEEVDEQELEEDPAAVDGEILPVDSDESFGVDVCGEETGALSEDLHNSDTTGSLRVWPDFYQVGWRVHVSFVWENGESMETYYM